MSLADAHSAPRGCKVRALESSSISERKELTALLSARSVSDFVTGCTVKSERRIRTDFRGPVPTTTADFVEAYAKSDVCHRMQEELQHHLCDSDSLEQEAANTLAIVQREKHNGAPKSQPYKVSFARQLQTAIRREFQQRTADKFGFWARQITTLAMSFGESYAHQDHCDVRS